MGSMSQNTGRAPARAMVPAVAKNVNGEVMTSSPGADFERHQRQQQRIGARGHADADRRAAVPAISASSPRTCSPKMNC